MKAITKYKADDGREFNDEQSCINHESLKAKIKKIMSQLNDIKGRNCDFSNGSGFIQQEKDVVDKVRNEIIDLIKSESGDRSYAGTIELHRNKAPRHGWISYCLGENSPFNSCWYRIECIDDNYREWGQIYFANNPDKGTQKQLN